MKSQFKAKGTCAEIWLYDQIGQSFWGEGVSAKTFQKELNALGRVDTINLRINSPGGDVFDGLAIFNQLKSHRAQIVVDIDGLAASIASVIAMAGDEIRIASNAMMMIHNPHGMAVGDAREMARMSVLLEQIKDGSLIDTYAQRTAQSRDRLAAWMDDETWLSSEAAVQYGFADSITSAMSVAACADVLARFHNVPDALKKRAVSGAAPLREMADIRLAEQAKRLFAIA